ncbi:MAG TPA: GNAT family N-acetyltransferase [Acidimicrobiales bacterium]|nr:GNAT family N-acetyltransferase [Acidimicrobiales bacterium]
MHVRQLGPDEVETLRTIRLEALRSDPDAFGSTLERELGRTDDDWRAWLGRGATFVAEDSTGPAGLVAVVHHEELAAVGVYAMFVSDRARGQGVGRALVEAGIAWAASSTADRLVLLVIEGNGPATTLYESCGFTRTGRSEVRERDGVTEVEMARRTR